MNAPFNTSLEFANALLPAEFESLSSPPLLLPGEVLEKYELMRHAIFAELAPHTAIEWLLAIDVAELSWEIQRYRVLRHKLLEHYREKAIEQCLRHIDLPEVHQTQRKTHITISGKMPRFGEQSQRRHPSMCRAISKHTRSSWLLRPC